MQNKLNISSSHCLDSGTVYNTSCISITDWQFKATFLMEGGGFYHKF